MALDGTYTGLKASIADFLNRSDLTSAIPDFIVLAEAQMHRRMVGRQRQGLPIPRRLILRTDTTFATDDEYVAVPTDISGPLVFELTDSDGTILELDYLEPVNLDAEKARAFWTGAPKYYTVVGTELKIFPAADRAYDGELTYIKRLAAASGATNWILTDYPDAYLEGAIWSAKKYLSYSANEINDQLAVFVGIIDDICNADPMPSDKSTLRSETACLTRPWRAGYYNINTDS